MPRLKYVVSGRVQGVGFRPYLWRLAESLALRGFCRNSDSGVEIEVEGDPDNLAAFEHELGNNPPRLAAIANIVSCPIDSAGGESGFCILPSSGHAGREILVSPDMAICQDCISDIREAGNPRQGYAFTNCTNCGPRFSITRDLPYDRPLTCMACFAMCANCGSEYGNPADRRFHAQPVACPQCGPQIWFVTAEYARRGGTTLTPENSDNALERAASLLMTGGIIALRGLGGFQLVCDARNEQAVRTLRERKQRPHKAFAVMLPDLAACQAIASPNPAQAELLTGARKPIVLCAARQDVAWKEWIAPDSPYLGIMLPYTPLHVLLFDRLVASGADPALIMTSANPSGEPICLGNREALARLDHLADAWLLHNRDILSRVDDSVAGIGPDGPVLLRRSRGYVPEPLELERAGPSVLGAGSQLKAAFCITRGKYAFPGQHIGDLASPACLDFYEEAYRHLLCLLDVKPEIIACDLHPDYEATRFAKKLAHDGGLPLVNVQHHLAHAAACLAENKCREAALALCLDGSGLGTDGTIWGGELLLVDPGRAEWRRIGSLSNFALPGGEAAIRQPWRIAASFRHDLGLDPDKRSRPIYEMLDRKINCVQTSSAGRLFDAVSALLGLCEEITYEGQAAIRLEQAATKWLAGAGNCHMDAPEIAAETIIQSWDMFYIDSAVLFRNCIELKESGLPANQIAAQFHNSLAWSFARLASIQGARQGVKRIALSGGVMQNRLFASLLADYLRQFGLELLLHRELPPGDGCLGTGQAVWAAWLAAAGML